MIAAVLGAVVGVATSFAQADLPGTWAALANAASPWLVAPLLAGILQPRRGTAITAGLLACAMQVAGYYVATPLRGFPVAGNEIAFWTACAVCGGPVFGWAGWAWRRGIARVRLIGAALLPATFFAEAVGSYAIRLHYRNDAVLFAVIGLLLLVYACWQTREPRAVLAWTLAVTAIGVVGYGPVLQAIAGFTFGG